MYVFIYAYAFHIQAHAYSLHKPIAKEVNWAAVEDVLMKKRGAGYYVLVII